jgi:DNA-binding MarR family transcriptional regulator
MSGNIVNKYFVDLLNYSENNSEIRYYNNFDKDIRIDKEELTYAKNKYNVTNKELSLFYSLLEYMQYGTNIIVNNNKALNQKALTELLDLDRKTIYKNMADLESKHFIYSIKNGKNVLYTLNPYIVFGGIYLNLNAMILFLIEGYEPLKKIDIPKNNNINRYSIKTNDDKVGSQKNKKQLGTICYAEDGTQCLSLQEKKVHDYMIDNNIKIINKEGYYKNIINNQTLKDLAGAMRYDWLIEIKGQQYIVEYFGLFSDLAYKVKHDLKQKIIKLDSKENNFISDVLKYRIEGVLGLIQSGIEPGLISEQQMMSQLN